MHILKVFGSVILIIIIIFFLFWIFIRYYQTHGIYFPTKEIHYTPNQLGLEYREINFNATDKVQLNGWFIPNRNSNFILLFCHGNAGNISHRLDLIKLFHSIDLNVFIFDYRGYGKSNATPSEDGFYRDALGAYNYLTNEMKYEPEKIVIYGKSIGANVAINLASRVKAAALISDSAFCSAIHMSKTIFPFLPKEWINKAATSKFIQKNLKKLRILLIKFDALSKIKNIKMPKLIIHSKDDEMIPFTQGKKLFKATSEPKEFYPLHGGHNESIIMHKMEYSRKISNFLEEYLSK